jgi:choline kinase
VLLNGDTVFEPAVLQRLLAAPAHPVTVAINRKAHYDDDDMKVRLDGERLLEVGKGLPLARVDGESIGMMRFSGAGPLLFRDALERAVRHRGSRRQFYLSVVDELAKAGQVRVCDISGLDWSEVDYPLDLSRASRMAANWVTAAGAQVSSAG